MGTIVVECPCTCAELCACEGVTALRFTAVGFADCSDSSGLVYEDWTATTLNGPYDADEINIGTGWAYVNLGTSGDSADRGTYVASQYLIADDSLVYNVYVYRISVEFGCEEGVGIALGNWVTYYYQSFDADDNLVFTGQNVRWSPSSGGTAPCDGSTAITYDTLDVPLAIGNCAIVDAYTEVRLVV